MWTVWRQELQPYYTAIFFQKQCEQNRMVVSGIVQNYHHTLAAWATSQQLFQENLEGFCIELVAGETKKLARPHIYCSEASDRFARRSKLQYRVFGFRWYPHP
jgi:hypothetical protein